MYNQSLRGFPIGRTGRVLLAAWSLLLFGGFALAAGLEPDPRGYGTHQSLGLPPCSFKTIFGMRCPSCGMTTSFAHFTKGHVIEAARANLAGLLLAMLCAVQIPWCWTSIVRGELFGVVRPDAWLVWLLVALSGTCLLQWGVRLIAL